MMSVRKWTPREVVGVISWSESMRLIHKSSLVDPAEPGRRLQEEGTLMKCAGTSLLCWDP